MASFMYTKALEWFLSGTFNWPSNDIRAIFIDTADYTADQATHDYLDDVAAGARVAVSAASLANKVATGGVADADDLTINSVSGDQFEAVLLYKHTGTDGTSNLMVLLDGYSGLPCTPNGGNITISWPNDSNKIFKL